MNNLKNENQNSEIYLLVTIQGLNIQNVYPFAGPAALETAEYYFEQFTGINYKEYEKRRHEGEDNNEILSEDDEGTEIYVLQPNYCLLGLNPKTILSEGISKWNYQTN